ncbi:MAG: D-2-hydroxyacid dehydrogenase [Saprospiraceae bacterium]
MIKVLANDGISDDGKLLLEEAGYEVQTTKIPQEELAERLNHFDALIVRSATKVRQELIDKAPNLKLIARGGVGMDNIDVEYARGKGIKVVNTPAASSQSVAELVFAHIFSLSRFLHLSHLEMRDKGDTAFKDLKKSYAKGTELRGKTIGIIGFGRIGQAVARMAIGMGMRVLAHDPMVKEANLELDFPGFKNVGLNLKLETVQFETVLQNSDFITFHVPGGASPLLGANEFEQLKNGVVLINTARGGTIDEDELLKALSSGKVRGAGLDVFVGEPTPRKELLSHPNISLSPHIGASTDQAQTNIGMELAERIMEHFGH